MSNPTKDSFKKACERMLVSSDGKMLKDTMNENTFKTEEYEFTIRAHIIEAKEMQEAKRTALVTNVGNSKLSPVVRVSWIKDISKESKVDNNDESTYEVLAVKHTTIRNDTNNPTYDQLIVFKKLMTA